MKFVLILTLLFSISSVLAKDILIDKVIATVNGSATLYSQIKTKIDNGTPVLLSSFPALESDSEFIKSIQDEINYMLIQQKAEELNIEVADERVEKFINNRLKSSNTSHEQLIEFLSQRGQSYANYKKDIKKSLLLTDFHRQVIYPSITITDSEIQTEYFKTSNTGSSDVLLKLRQIIVNSDTTLSVDLQKSKKELIDKVYRRLKDGMDFIEAVKLYSDATNAQSSLGEMNGINLSDLSKDIQEAVKKLEVNDFTRPIKTALGYHIFMLAEKRIKKSADYKEKRRKIEYELRTKKLAKKIEFWLQEQRDDSKIKVYSNIL